MSATEFPIGANTGPAIADINALINAIRKTGKEAGLAEDKIEHMVDDVKKLGKEGTNQIGGLNKNLDSFVNGTLKKAGGALVAFFAVDKILDFGKAIIQITSEFQKFEAVLTTTLGSRSRALLALKQIQEFAAKTPFSVRELTESFVKLANQGFVPTEEEMRKLGDLAASTGKTFDMLAEAIIDAQTGEFERLKEFGVRASKQGEQVTFTFKGVETQTKFTTEAIRDYVLSLGDAIGVSGSMASISETLGGKISNLGDAWDTLLKTLGDQQEGPLKNAINNLTLFLATVTDAVKTTEQLQEELELSESARAVKNLQTLAAGYGDLKAAGEDYLKLLEGQLVVERRYNDSLDRLDDNNEDKIKQSYAKIHVIQAQIAAIKDYVAQNYKAGQSDKEVRLGLIESLEKQIKALETAKKKATTIEDIELLNAKLWDLRHELNMLQEAGKNLAQPFDEGVLKGFSKVVEKEMDGTQERINANLAKRAEEWTRIYNANLRKQKDDTKLTIEQIEEIWQEGFNSFTTLVQAVTDYRSANNAAELDDLQAKSEYEQELAGDNVKAREKIEKEFDKKQRKLRQEQAERDRKMALFNIAISTSQGIMSALAQLPPNIPLSILIGITGAAQGALVAAKPARFAKGVYDLEGPGSSTSDSIPALLSAHESVVPADRNKKFGFFLKEIIENPALDLWDVKNMIDEKLPTQYAKIIMNPGTGADSKEMLDELRATRRAIENKPAVRIDVDENGFNVSIQRGNHWTKYANSRYTADV